MGSECCASSDPHRGNPAYRRVLWLVLAINTVMFLVEVGAGLAAGSASLQADALDFLGDAGNYAISLLVVGMALHYRAIAAFLKGATMGVFGLWVLSVTGWHVWHGTVPFFYGLSVAETRTCGRRGFARATMYSATLRCSLPPLECLAREPVGRT
jgi:hypothetical protein